MIKVF